MRHHVNSSIVSWALMVTSAAVLAACSDTPAAPEPGDKATVLNSVTVAPQTIVMAAGATLQLGMTASSLTGAAVSDFDAVTFVSNDSSRVKVSDTGLITAATGPDAVTDGPVTVIATAYKDGVTRSDTAYVAVVATAGTSPQFSIHTPYDTITKLAVGGTQFVNASLQYTVNGGTVDMPAEAIPVKIRVSPATYGYTVGANTFSITGSMDTIRVYASLNVFGTTLTDSTKYPLGDPTSLYIFMNSSGLSYFQGTGYTLASAFTTATTVYLQQGGFVEFGSSLYNSPYVFGVSFTAAGNVVAPDPVSGINADSFTRFDITFSDTGTFTYTWTGDASKLLPANQLSSKIVVR